MGLGSSAFRVTCIREKGPEHLVKYMKEQEYRKRIRRQTADGPDMMECYALPATDHQDQELEGEQDIQKLDNSFHVRHKRSRTNAMPMLLKVRK